MRKLTIGILSSALLASVLLISTIPSAISDDDDGDRRSQSDQGLFGLSPDVKAFCGSDREPWELHISGAATSSPGTIKLTYRDSDSITYPVPAGQAFSADYAFGGVPFVDDTVMIEVSGGVDAATVTALATGNARDPFDEDDDGKAGKDVTGVGSEKDNFCVIDPSEMNVEEDSGDLNSFFTTTTESTVIGKES